MTYRDRFEAAMARRGYEVSRLGLITVCKCETREGRHYTAMHFFCADGTLNKEKSPSWDIS